MRKRNQRKVAFAALIGTTIEWYDYFTYSTAAALIFAGNNASGYMTNGGFVAKYATDPVGFSQTDVLLAITFGSFVWLVSLVKDRKGIDLSVGNEAEQSVGVWRREMR